MPPSTRPIVRARMRFHTPALLVLFSLLAVVVDESAVVPLADRSAPARAVAGATRSEAPPLFGPIVETRR